MPQLHATPTIAASCPLSTVARAERADAVEGREIAADHSFPVRLEQEPRRGEPGGAQLPAELRRRDEADPAVAVSQAEPVGDARPQEVRQRGSGEGLVELPL